MMLSIDPGLRACGVALWSDTVDGELVWARALRGPKDGRGPALWAAYGRLVRDLFEDVDPWGHLVIETMKQYVNGKADPDDLLELQGVSGAIVGVLSSRGWSVEGVLARDWNGQVPSKVRRARTQAWVESKGWTSRVDVRTTQRYQQDVWSAVGIGRWATSGPAGRRSR